MKYQETNSKLIEYKELLAELEEKKTRKSKQDQYKYKAHHSIKKSDINFNCRA